MVIDQILIDNILVSLGELNAERKHRLESDSTVTVPILGCRGYALVWHTGNKLDITSDAGVLSTLYLKQFDTWTRFTAVAIAGIVLGHAEMWKRLIEE